ncbi:unnamed protein product [Gongylonema pulchrum]|uniref:Secreted protein n=1 Tax=Gongylonema pulchrum TaxID=637853 RepID=A0A183DGY9_9BILA|nr:unnamed protein product [Gongylonema pulchrum]VDK60424.1 unnamed protein product [Gongylonema pulchrum]
MKIMNGCLRSLGVVAFVLVNNKMPYNEQVASNDVIVEAQRQRSYRYSRKLQISQACRCTIDWMMTFDYDARPSIQQVRHCPQNNLHSTNRGTC